MTNETPNAPNPRVREGDNSDMADQAEVNAGQLRSFIERVERLEEERAGIRQDIKKVYAEAKGNGFDTKIIRKVISIRRMDRDKRREEEEILDIYLNALGLL